ncbi:MAG: hypothetical protein KDA75_16420 [Planctomycetaceae bacterium]|nr:hypothetical protein [Planctomycetaceae bacterium]
MSRHLAAVHISTSNESSALIMRNWIGMSLQFLALVFLPLLILWQLEVGFQLIWMPSMLLVGVVVFSIGHLLREKTE